MKNTRVIAVKLIKEDLKCKGDDVIINGAGEFHSLSANISNISK